MFITLEGIEGSGKTTLMPRLAASFQAQGREVLTTREPGGCALGQRLRQLLLDPAMPMAPQTELFLFLADRAQHVSEVIGPALRRNAVVLCDRYIDSTIVYQGYGRGLDLDSLVHLNALAIGDVWPDLTLLLDMDPEAALTRARARNLELGLTDAEGRFEAEQLAFHLQIRQGFRLWAERNPQRIVLLDASDTPEGVLNQALMAVKASTKI